MLYRETVEALLKLVNNSTSNSLDSQARQTFYAERKRLAALLRHELQTAKRDA